MVARLRDIAAGRLKATQADLNFYTRELRKIVRYRQLGHRTGAGDNYELRRIVLMAAFNWVLVSARCPACSEQTMIRAQTHIASSYDGDAHGRFSERAYKLGESMLWWPPTDARFDDWKEDGLPSADGSGDIEEACYAACDTCAADLCAVLRFRDVTPIKCVAVSTAKQWPAGFPR